MNTARRYVRVVVMTSTPVFLVATVSGLTHVAAASAAMLFIVAVSHLKHAGEAFLASLKQMGIFGVIASAAGLAACGVLVFRWAWMSGSILAMPTGVALAAVGFHLTRAAVRKLVLKPKPKPPALPKPLPIQQTTIVLQPTVPVPVPTPATPPPPPPPKPMPRDIFKWGAREVSSRSVDQFFFAITGPPGRGKTAILRLMLKSMINEVMDVRCHSTVVCFDPKRELYAWIAGQMPPERKSGIPRRLLCPTDTRTCTLDYAYDFSSAANHGTFAFALGPRNPNLSQPFFEDAFRAVVAETAGAIQRKAGKWDPYLLTQILANSGRVKKLVSKDTYAGFVAELLSSRSRETAQNVQMEITSKIRKWRMLGALQSHVKTQIPERVLSLERFLERRGVLVIQSDEDFAEELNAFNAMVLMQICQILMKRQPEDVRNSKVYIVIDEFPSLGNIPGGFVKAVRELRSRNVVFVITWQNWADIVHNWKDEAESLEGCLQNFIILGSASPQDAEHAEKLLGKIRGTEAERSTSATSGTSESRTDGSSDTTGSSFSQTRVAGTSGDSWNRPYVPPPPVPGGGGGGFTPTDTRSVSNSHTKSRSATQGTSYSSTEGVAYKYFERALWTATEVMRNPIPSREGGFHGIAYVAGDPAPHQFVYEAEFLENEGVFSKNEDIPDYIEWPEKYQLPEPLSTAVLASLNLEGPIESDPDAYPTPEEAEAAARAQTPSPQQQPASRPAPGPVTAVAAQEGPCDWDALEPEPDDNDPERYLEEILGDQTDPDEPAP
jgi:hypothetical protein